MDVFEKIALLKQDMAFEDPEPVVPPTKPALGGSKPCGMPAGGCREHAFDPEFPIFMASMPGGKRIPLLKTMLSTVCERNCNYCFCRAGRDIRRQTFRPEELMKAFMRMAQKGAVQGLFLSSGIAGGGCRTQDRLLDAADILRNKLGFQGYVHLKLMPGAEQAQVERAMQLSSRVSVNLEAPTSAHLHRLAPMKQLLEELVQPLRWVEECRRNQPQYKGWNGRWPSSTTQFVVGAAGESDLDLLRASDYLHRKLRLGRVYFSGFEPLDDTPFEGLQAAEPWRRIRLYQADFLLRDYDFSFEDIPYDQAGNLPLDADPKLAWAREFLSEKPVEINRAAPRELMRVPGIGPKGVAAILAARRKNKIKNLEDLRALGVRTEKLKPFVLLDGRQPAYQPGLW